MLLYRTPLRTLGAAALLALALACGGNDSSSTTSSDTITLSGTVTYTRIPLAKDANGVPTGLADSSVAANLETKPARGVMVRLYQRHDQTNPDGSQTAVWTLVTSAFTDANGAYRLTPYKDKPLMVEVLSTFHGGGGQVVNLIADPAGLGSTEPEATRLRYALRKAVDGTAPAGVPAPASVPTGDAVVDFKVGLTDKWWLVNAYADRYSDLTPGVPTAIDETSLAGRTQGTGSRVLAIGDTLATFLGVYGEATPGAPLDLHYAPGVSEPRGSFIDYDDSRYPLAYDPLLGRPHYFGSIQGGPANDDAWDEGVILPLFARNRLFSANRTRTFAIPLALLQPVSAALPDLSPDLARIEGFAEAMAANLLESPYLADTHGTALAAPVLDIRDIGALAPDQLGPQSAPALRAMAWEVILKANGIASPGTPTTWANINPVATTRFFLAPSPTNGASDGTARDIEPLNAYSQLARLKEGMILGEPVDLAAIFTDATLGSLVAPYGLTWPRPTTGAHASFAADWGTDPNALTTPLAPFTLSMAKATQVGGAYPNLSQGEVKYAGFNLTVDKRYVISVSLAPALDPGVQVDLDLPQINRTFSFTGAGGSTGALTLPVNATAPYFHPVRVRLKSPTLVQPDVAVTVAFTPSL